MRGFEAIVSARTEARAIPEIVVMTVVADDAVGSTPRFIPFFTPNKARILVV